MNLPPELRREVLSDISESLQHHIPEEMLGEYRMLRIERESQRRVMDDQRNAIVERLARGGHLQFSHSGRRDLDLFTHSSWGQPSSQGMRYAVVNVNPHMLDNPAVRRACQSRDFSHFSRRITAGSGQSNHHPKTADLNSKQMLDQDALTCLLVLLFLDQSKLHNNRLHRIIRNLSQHSPTRAWILSSLLAIIKEMRKSSPSSFPGHAANHLTSSAGALSSTCPMPPPLVSNDAGVLSATLVSATTCTVSASIPQPQPTSPHWLDMGINAALGSHAKILQFTSGAKGGKGSNGDGGSKVNIHPLAGMAICYNILDLLIFLGRHFSNSFLPSSLMPPEGGDKTRTLSAGEGGEDKSKREEDVSGEAVVTNFWQILMKLNSAAGRKGKGPLKGFKYSDSKEAVTDQEIFSNSIIGQLMGLFTHDIIKDNIALVDKLLRILSIASSTIPATGFLSAHSGKEFAAPGKNLEDSVSPVAGNPDKSSKSQDERALGVEGKANSATVAMELSIVAPHLLDNIISVLISGRCTEDGLEEATTLLTNLSKCSIPTRKRILYMLLDGVKTIGHTLCHQISVLSDSVTAGLQEHALEQGLNVLDQQDKVKNAGKKKMTTSSLAGSAGASNVLTGIVLPTAGTEDHHMDHSHDLHIPAMVPLTCKGSQQSFFVRMLKVVCHLMESAQQAIVSVNSSTPSGAAAATTTAATSSADVNASLTTTTTTTTTTTMPTTASATSATPITTDSTATTAAIGASESSGGQRMEGSEAIPSGTMEVVECGSGVLGTNETTMTLPDQSAVTSAHNQVTAEASYENKPRLWLSLLENMEEETTPSFLRQTLSVQLELDDLWVVLSKCLDALSHTDDPHAVFVLQSTVEAFFLVHANFKEEGAGSSERRRALDIAQLRSSRCPSTSAVDGERGLGSPAFSPLPGTPGPGEGQFNLFAHLPPDTARFLRFAGNCAILYSTDYVLHCTLPHQHVTHKILTVRAFYL